METMRPSGPVKLESIESGLYKEVGVTVTLINNKCNVNSQPSNFLMACILTGRSSY